MKVLTLAPYCMAVASSEPDISAPPSPRNRITWRLGWRSAAATAAGMPMPIAPPTQPINVCSPENRKCRQPAGEIAGVGYEDRVLVDRLGERGNDRAHIEQPSAGSDQAMLLATGSRSGDPLRAWPTAPRRVLPAPPGMQPDRRSARAPPRSCGRSGAHRRAHVSAVGADAAPAAAYSPAWSPRRGACRRQGSDRRPGSGRWWPWAS